MSTHPKLRAAALLLLAPVLLGGVGRVTAYLGMGEQIAVAAPSASTDDVVDISGSRDKLRAFTDGKKHYLVLIPFDFNGPLFFYGDGTTFYAQRSFGGGRSGDESFNRSFWEPRVANRSDSMFQLREKKYTLYCSNRETNFVPVSYAENAAILAKGKFLRPRWKHQSYWLARDERANYYFVDRAREPEGNKSFRLFVGPKGNLKQQKMTNVVSDTKGDIFSTKTGELRLIMNATDAAWVHGKVRVKLTAVPIEDNHILVYTDLGVYTGERLGTPCDDL